MYGLQAAYLKEIDNCRSKIALVIGAAEYLPRNLIFAKVWGKKIL